jgi:uncharacterized membrane protein
VSGSLANLRVLLAGESWITHGTHAKGAVSYANASYEEGAGVLIDALTANDADVTYIANHLAVEGFPRSVAELLAFDAVILSDLPSDTLLLDRACFVDGTRGTNRLEELAQYVEAGGGLLMIGGYMSFTGIEGKARYGMTPLARVLPVAMLSSDDRVETPEGVVPHVVAPDHPIVLGLDANWPYFLGYNKVDPKPESQVLMSIRQDPLLVINDVGLGRAGAFASDCSPHWGSHEFVRWRSYAGFWSQLVGWIARPDQPDEVRRG